MEDDSEQTFRKYEEELEINDFPQQARWRVTSKVNRSKYMDICFPFLMHIFSPTFGTINVFTFVNNVNNYFRTLR